MTKPWAIITINGAIESRFATRELATQSRDRYILPNRQCYWVDTLIVNWPELGQPGRESATRRIFEQLYKTLGCPRPEVLSLC